MNLILSPMETQTETLELLVKLASLGTAGICIIGIFYTGIIVKSLPNNVSPSKLSAVRMYKNMCIVIAVICSISGCLNAYYNMGKIEDAKKNAAEIENQYSQQADSFMISKDAIGKDLDELNRIMENQPGTSSEASSILSRISTDVNSMVFRPSGKNKKQ